MDAVFVGQIHILDSKRVPNIHMYVYVYCAQELNGAHKKYNKYRREVVEYMYGKQTGYAKKEQQSL